MKPTKRSKSILAGSIATILTAPLAQSATIYWDGGSNSWNTAANWSTASGATTPDPAAVPGALDNAVFNITSANGAETVTLDANQAAKSINPLSPALQSSPRLLPAGRSSPTAVQVPPAKSKFLAV